MKHFIFILFLPIFGFTMFSGLAFAEVPRARLERLRAEIDSLSNVLNAIRLNEKNLGERIATLDQQIQTRHRLLNELEAQIRGERRAVDDYNKKIRSSRRQKETALEELKRTENEVATLEDLIRRRAVFVYKHGERESLRFLLAASNPGDLFERRIYVRRIQQRDERNLQRLRDARQRQIEVTRSLEKTLRELSVARDRKALAVSRLEGLIKENRSLRNRLADDRDGINVLLEKVSNDRATVLAMIDDRERSLEKVKSWVENLEKQRAVGGTVQEYQVSSHAKAEIVVRNVPNFASFSKARGKLPWPVRGEILRRFGLEKNSVTGTVTENPGIDIEAEAGEEVIAVQGGVCTRITYLRGFGTTMLIEHGDGYYTVYAHLGDVWVSEGEKVEAGRVLGTVGVPGTPGRTRLHFQVWHKRQNEDPLKWLG